MAAGAARSRTGGDGMILGVDLDNTLICYDGLFHDAAVLRGMLPPDSPRDKRGVRDSLLARGREDDFTVLQGYVYGPGLKDAGAYPGALECLRRLRALGVPVCVISHKTAAPVLGPPYDLRRAAREWLDGHGFFSLGAIDRGDVFFADTVERKAERVAERGCTHFIDDMERFLVHPAFPPSVEKLWFRPKGEGESDRQPAAGGAFSALHPFSSWREIEKRLLFDAGKTEP